MSKPKTSYLRLHRMLRDSEPEPAKTLAGVQKEQQVVSAMYAYLMNSWDELPDQTKHALGFDLEVGGEGEEAALNRLAKIFLDYADLSLKRALIARRRRLGCESGPTTTH